MKRTLVGGAILALAVGGTGFALADKPGDTDTTKTSRTTQPRDCGDGDTVSLAGPDTLWPPNHKLVQQVATATDGASEAPADDTSNDTSLTVMPSVLDAVGGDGNTAVDWEFPDGMTASGDPSAVLPFSVRAERSGRGEGRTYTFHWTATFDGGAKSCSSNTQDNEDPNDDPFTIFVPHDQGRNKTS